MKSVILLALAFLVVGCKEDTPSRKVAGVESIDLPCDHKFVNAGWSAQTGLWYAYRPAEWADRFVTITWQQQSIFGVPRERLNFVEHKCNWKDNVYQD